MNRTIRSIGRRTARTSYWRRRDQLVGWAFSAPALFLLLTFLIVPFVMALGFSFTNQRLVAGPLPTQFVGWRNYLQLLQDDTLHRALFNNSLFGWVVVPVQTGLALFLALLINQKLRGVTIFRLIYFSPVVTPLVVVSVVWAFLYNPGQGLMNAFIKTVSFGYLGPYTWLNDGNLALPAIMLLTIWQGVGFQMIVYLAGLLTIPESLYETARVDGAGRWQQFWHITFPQLSNTTFFVVIATTVQAFKLYTQIEVLTQGGPANATVTVVWYMVHQSIRDLRVGYASAIAVVIFFLVIMRIVLILRSVLLTEAKEV
ncbi:carbohydrate ABC transporter permease [Dictyobacter formicarum]|uniref:ABC transporter permease n=1 Tax=Dictyobacter formicarum TaxID=2778368 RepID=A0ABQ3VFI4_9CHLR|nr:sugar ABC transporter permease [Dictyobacter formicarum]GHO84413.1 ABC transporter permease [Dictyobacter formicarum]